MCSMAQQDANAKINLMACTFESLAVCVRWFASEFQYHNNLIQVCLADLRVICVSFVPFCTYSLIMWLIGAVQPQAAPQPPHLGELLLTRQRQLRLRVGLHRGRALGFRTPEHSSFRRRRLLRCWGSGGTNLHSDTHCEVRIVSVSEVSTSLSVTLGKTLKTARKIQKVYRL